MQPGKRVRRPARTDAGNHRLRHRTRRRLGDQRTRPPTAEDHHVDAFHRAWDELELAVKATRMVEVKSLFLTLKMWRRELLTFCRTRVTNARSEAANLSAKNLKRAARGYRNHDHYRLRLVLYTAAQQAG
ncbi:transposase [Pseudarthrobacter sp. BIM B-2242]|nr:transposase [Pseudarthrobacter sp. BIM B-2242]